MVMHTTSRRGRGMVAGLMALAAMAAVPSVRAENGPPEFLRASVQLGATQKVLQDLRLPAPFVDEARRDMERAPFIGAGGLNLDKPLGLVLYAVEANPGERFERTLERSVLLAVPVNQGFATIEKIGEFAKGMDPAAVVAGDTVTSKRLGLRRLNDYLFAAPSGADLVPGAVDNPFKNDYKNPGVLATATLNLAALRKGAPKLVEAFWADVERTTQWASPAEKVGAESTIKFMKDTIASIDVVSATVSADDTAVRFAALVSPMNIKAVNAAPPRPTFPAGTIAQIHVAYPNAKAASWAPDAIAALDFKTILKDPKVTAEDVTAITGILNRGAKLFLAPDAMSVGVTVDAGKPLVMVVNQYAPGTDFGKEIRTLAGEINALAKTKDTPKLIDVTEYEAKGEKVTRLTLLDNERAVGYVDFAQKGNVVAMTITDEDVKKVADVIALPAKGKLSDFVHASLDLGETFKAAQEMVPLPDTMVTKIAKAVDGKSVTLVVTSAENGKSMTVEASVPMAVLKDLGELFGGMMGGPGGGNNNGMP